MVHYFIVGKDNRKMQRLIICLLIILSGVVEDKVFSQNLHNFIVFGQIPSISPISIEKDKDSINYLFEGFNFSYFHSSDKIFNDSIEIGNIYYSLDNRYMQPNVHIFNFAQRKYLFLVSYLKDDLLFHEGARDGYLIDITELEKCRFYKFRKMYLDVTFFGDYNNDKNLDFIKVENIGYIGNEEKIHQKVSDEFVDCYNYLKFSCLTIKEDALIEVESETNEPYYVFCAIGGDCIPKSVVLDHMWFH